MIRKDACPTARTVGSPRTKAFRGQSGQWKCIAGMKRGRQKVCSSLDPIYLRKRLVSSSSNSRQQGLSKSHLHHPTKRARPYWNHPSRDGRAVMVCGPYNCWPLHVRFDYSEPQYLEVPTTLSPNISGGPTTLSPGTGTPSTMSPITAGPTTGSPKLCWPQHIEPQHWQPTTLSPSTLSQTRERSPQSRTTTQVPAH